ncbi:MAG: phospholipid scramblase-related protein [Fibrobacteria bacterium]
MLNKKAYFIREHVGLLKLSDTYELLDPETSTQVGIAQEKPGLFVHVLRFLINKRLLPTQVFVYEGANAEDQSRLLFSIKRGVALFQSKVEICGKHGQPVGSLVSKLFSIGGAFRVYDASGREYALVQGDWKGWNFKITDTSGAEIGTLSKKWAGMGKEMFTSADNYMISLRDEPDAGSAILLLAASLAVDTIYKER